MMMATSFIAFYSSYLSIPVYRPTIRPQINTKRHYIHYQYTPPVAMPLLLNTQFSIICSIRTMPLIGVRESCISCTVPVVRRCYCCKTAEVDQCEAATSFAFQYLPFPALSPKPLGHRLLCRKTNRKTN